ncbi:SDR family NAD(P)-dependent oxidoreductase [Microbacterium sp. KHB019]|jgi:NAD(P)-dependent dehydrogenase (short-subunit alcohol dehydrogenase family)|uniref:SDR family NAD(P)-dependent oxidoreductase n=1 Tax=Microbacterium sp. KHB019 TaxID=3129770 RepID=UPI00307AD557
MDIAGKTALITGGSSGLGLATARRLIERGASVAVVDLAGEANEAAVADLGERAVFLPADVTSEADVAAAVDRVIELTGSIDIVVNCAGIVRSARVVGHRGPFPLEVFRSVIEVNLIGTFNVIRLAAEAMAKSLTGAEERGVIVCTASVAAFEGQIGQAAYSASKAGVAGMTLPIARELAESKIRVVTIAPGLFHTPMFESLPAEAVASLGAQTPHPSRLGKPEEYAALVQHIVENPMLNGETIRLDGAVRMAAK